MQSKSISANSVEALKVELSKIKEINFQPTLAMIFSSPVFDLKEISTIFDEQNIDLFGLTSAGEIIDGKVTETAIVGLIFDLNRDYYRIQLLENNFDTLFQSGEEAGNFAKQAFKHPALMIGSGGLTIDAEQIVYGYKAVLGEDVAMFGGLAGDDWELKNTYVFSRKNSSNNGIITLVFDYEKVVVQGLAICGWEPIGNINTITKAEGNIVHTINHEPALDVFLRYFGYFESTESVAAALNKASAQYPLQLIREDGTSVLRSPFMSNVLDKTLTLAGAVYDGDQFRFSIAPGLEVIDQTVNEFGTLKNDFPEADALILFSCKGRHAALGPLIEEEVEGIYNYWKKPMIGFFSYGEVGNVKGGNCDFHNETCSLVILKER